MTIKVKDASQREAVPASAAQIAEIQADLSIATPTAVQTLIEANDNLGALATPVQTLVNTGVSTAQARSGHTGNDPAANVVFADNLTLACNCYYIYVWCKSYCSLIEYRSRHCNNYRF